MSALIGLLFYVFLFWFIVKLMKSKNKQPSKTSPAGKGQPAVQNAAAQRSVRARKAVQQPAQSELPDSTRDSSDPNAYFGEGEDPAMHNAHLMQSTQEGESDEEHASHMRAADQHKAVQTTSTSSAASNLKSNSASLRRAVVMSEILGKPAALRSARYNGQR